MKKRFLSLIIALAMMVGVFTPLLSSELKTSKISLVIKLQKTLEMFISDLKS